MVAQPGMVGLPASHDECRELREALAKVTEQRDKLLACAKAVLAADDEAIRALSVIGARPGDECMALTEQVRAAISEVEASLHGYLESCSTDFEPAGLASTIAQDAYKLDDTILKVRRP